jgi:hypothetical protein
MASREHSHRAGAEGDLEGMGRRPLVEFVHGDAVEEQAGPVADDRVDDRGAQPMVRVAPAHDDRVGVALGRPEQRRVVQQRDPALDADRANPCLVGRPGRKHVPVGEVPLDLRTLLRNEVHHRSPNELKDLLPGQRLDVGALQDRHEACRQRAVGAAELSVCKLIRALVG